MMGVEDPISNPELLAKGTRLTIAELLFVTVSGGIRGVNDYVKARSY